MTIQKPNYEEYDVCDRCEGDGYLSVGEGLYECPKCRCERFVPVRFIYRKPAMKRGKRLDD